MTTSISNSVRAPAVLAVGLNGEFGYGHPPADAIRTNLWH
jgi:hypothetical protein